MRANDGPPRPYGVHLNRFVSDDDSTGTTGVAFDYFVSAERSGFDASVRARQTP